MLKPIRSEDKPPRLSSGASFHRVWCLGTIDPVTTDLKPLSQMALIPHRVKVIFAGILARDPAMLEGWKNVGLFVQGDHIGFNDYATGV